MDRCVVAKKKLDDLTHKRKRRKEADKETAQ